MPSLGLYMPQKNMFNIFQLSAESNSFPAPMTLSFPSHHVIMYGDFVGLVGPRKDKYNKKIRKYYVETAESDESCGEDVETLRETEELEVRHH